MEYENKSRASKNQHIPKLKYEMNRYDGTINVSFTSLSGLHVGLARLVKNVSKQLRGTQKVLESSSQLSWWKGSDSAALRRSYTQDQRAKIILFMNPDQPFPYDTLIDHVEFVRIRLRDMWQVIGTENRKWNQEKEAAKDRRDPTLFADWQFKQLKVGYRIFQNMLKHLRPLVQMKSTKEPR